MLAPLDQFGVFIDGFGEFTGKSVFAVNEPIYESLKAKGVFYRLEDYGHRYPYAGAATRSWSSGW